LIVLTVDASIIDLWVILNSRMSFAEHVDMVGIAVAMLEFVERISSEFRDPYNNNAQFYNKVRSFISFLS
jgi:hypothetical protein